MSHRNPSATEGGLDDMPTPWTPYLNDPMLRSAGRTSLVSAFSIYMAARSGISPQEMANAFAVGGDENDRQMVEREIAFLSKIFVEGQIRTFARQFGGGEPVELPPSAWELDDAVPRFASGALSLETIHDPSCTPTHWIFVDNAQWDAAMDGLRQNLGGADEPWAGPAPEPECPASINVERAEHTPDAPIPALPDGAELWRNEILNLAGVLSATGLKRSTVYAKIGDGSFPAQIPIHGTRVGWRRGEIQDWLDGLTTKERP
jgi:predicted DNA-binding transcriptional regulator AlpA